jgi:capsular exopolysaccharide synthesis family protein
MSPVFKTQVKSNDEINVSKITDLFREKWYIILISLIMAVIASKLYLRYTRPVYEASTTLKIEENFNSFNTIDFLQEMNRFTNNIQSEIEILQSRSVVLEALKRMDVTASYYNVGTIRTSEMYKESPFTVLFEDDESVPYGQMFTFVYQSGDVFTLTWPGNPEQNPKQYRFYQTIDLDGFKFIIIRKKSSPFPLVPGATYTWQINDLGEMVDRVHEGLSVTQEGLTVSIIRISLKDHVAKFSADFVNSLSQVYLDRDIAYKTQAANQALEFIQAQLDSIRRGVEESEAELELFKRSSSMISVEDKIEQGMAAMHDLKTSRAQFLLREMDIQRLEGQVKMADELVYLPYSLEDNSNALLSGMITAHNEMVMEKLKLNENYTSEHPKVKEIETQLRSLKASILENIESMRVANQVKINYLGMQISKNDSVLDSIPNIQRNYIGLEREYSVKENILSTLLEKRAEASIARASIVPSVRIIDAAIAPTSPISPIPSKIYAVGVAVGLSVSIMLVLLTGMLKNTITYKEEIEAIAITPLIGVVKRLPTSLKHKYPRMQSIENPKSSLAESIRAIRTNLQFISSDKKTKVIAVTSTISGEGKSFITINLAGVISLLNRKIVILDMDLRKPKLHYSFGLDNSRGVSTFLVGKHELDEILLNTNYENLDIIPSGPIPPNPAELLQSFRLELLIMELKKVYDFILIDTPPIGLVTDGTTLLKQADISLFVVRSDYSKKSFASIPDQLVEDHKIKNLYIILNSVSHAGGKYSSYGYKVYTSGYYSDDDKRVPWWKFWKRLLNQRR